MSDCSVCESSFTRRLYRIKHERRKHPELFGVSCHTCTRKFKEDGHRAQHAKDKPCPGGSRTTYDSGRPQEVPYVTNMFAGLVIGVSSNKIDTNTCGHVFVSSQGTVYPRSPLSVPSVVAVSHSGGGSSRTSYDSGRSHAVSSNQIRPSSRDHNSVSSPGTVYPRVSVNSLGATSYSRGVGQARLYQLNSRDNLETYVDQEVQPDESHLNSYLACVDRLAHFLQNNIPEKYRPAEVIKGGSLGKGTAVKGKSDIDLTLMLKPANYLSVRSVYNDMDDILSVLDRYLRNYGECQVIGKSQKSIQIKLSGHSGFDHECDILPACKLDLSSAAKRSTIYQEMRNQTSEIREFYVPSLSPLQIRFIKSDRATKLKKLIRVVKDWKNTCLEDIKPPSSLVLELITIDQWERAGKPENFNLTKGLQNVINAIGNYKDLGAEWFDFYDRQFARSLVSHQKPYVVDPDNPFCNLMSDTKYRYWPQLSMKAKEFLYKPLFENSGRPSSDWRN